MPIKILGAVLIFSSCGGFGIVLASSHRREIRTLKAFVSALDYMECELQFRMCPLPVLCRMTAAESEGVLKKMFLLLAQELEDQIAPDVKRCVHYVTANIRNIPVHTGECFSLLGESLGRFDLTGQLKSLEAVRSESRARLNKITGDSEVRMRSYQTIGLCAGAALIILLM